LEEKKEKQKWYKPENGMVFNHVLMRRLRKVR
jgi:hypothetical protein